MSTLANDGRVIAQTLPWESSRSGPTVDQLLHLPEAEAAVCTASEDDLRTPVHTVIGVSAQEPASAPPASLTAGARVALESLAGGRIAVDFADAGQAAGFRTAALAVIVEHQRALLRREDDIHALLEHIMLAGGSLSELCAALAHFVHGSAIVTSTDGRVLAQSGVDGDLERTLALPSFDRSGRLLVEEEALGPRRHGDERDHRAFVKIVAGTSDLGLLGAFTPDRPMTEPDLHLLGRAATVAALAITKEQAVAAVESKYRAEFLRDALAGRAGEPGEALAHASALGWNLDRRLVVVVAETDENDAETTRTTDEVRALQERFVRAWTWAVRAKDPTIPVAGFSQEVVALLPVAEDADTGAVMRMVGDYVRTVGGHGGGGRRSFSTGVSRPVATAAALPTAYAEALKAVSVGRQMHGSSALTHFDGLGIYRLLALVPDSADLRRFVEESLGALVDDSVPEHADLRRTLSVLLDTNLNVAETSRLLFFHYNTLRYRIAKLEKMLGPFTTDPQLRLTLALALRVHEMHGI